MTYLSDTSATDSYGKGWQLFRANIAITLIVIVISMIISIPGSSGGGTDPERANAGRQLFAFIYNMLITTPISMSTAWVFLKLARGEDAQITDMFAVFQRNYVGAIIASILSSIVIGIGFVLLIIPGIYISIRLSFVSLLVIDEGMGGVEALQASWAMTKGYAGSIFLMGLIAIPLALVGLLALIIGIIPAAAIIGSAFGVLYYSVAERDGVPMGGKIKNS